MIRKSRWACLGWILLLLLFTADLAQAAGVGAPLTFRPAPPLNPNGPSGWLCQSQPYIPCRYIYPPDSCFKWMTKPGVFGSCTFVDGYEIDWLADWRRCGGMPCSGFDHTPRLSSGPSSQGSGTHWRLDVTFAEAGACTPDTCVALPIGELDPGEAAEFLEEDGALILAVPDTVFSLLTPGDATCPPGPPAVP